MWSATGRFDIVGGGLPQGMCFEPSSLPAHLPSGGLGFSSQLLHQYYPCDELHHAPHNSANGLHTKTINKSQLKVLFY